MTKFLYLISVVAFNFFLLFILLWKFLLFHCVGFIFSHEQNIFNRICKIITASLYNKRKNTIQTHGSHNERQNRIPVRKR